MTSTINGETKESIFLKRNFVEFTPIYKLSMLKYLYQSAIGSNGMHFTIFIVTFICGLGGWIAGTFFKI